jgi:hypothetical protein
VWPESFSSNLPPPHADEPAGLRQDIADELADHLAAAVAEALAHGAEEAAARKAALNRFGDPAAVARQLWLEAMKEPIMRQRTLLVAAALLVLAVFAANGLAWMAFQQLRESNAALVARLEAASNQTERPQLADLTVKLVRDNEAKSPAVGYQVDLVGPAVAGLSRQGTGYGGGGRDMLLREESNALGTVAYVSIEPGIYTLRVTTPWGASLRRNVSLLAREWTETIVCPSSAPEEANVSVGFAWPAELQERPLAVRLQFHRLLQGRSVNEWTEHSVFSMTRDPHGNEPSEISGLSGGSLLLTGFRPPADSLQVWPGLYDVTVSITERSGEVDSRSKAFKYSHRLRLGEDDLQQSQFIAKPGDNTWRIALTPQGIERVQEALSKAGTASASAE